MRMVILHSGFLMVKSFKWLTLFIFPLFQIFALAQEEREGGKGNSFTFGVGRRVCVGQPLARWKISCCWNFCIFSHQDGDASSSFDSDPTVCPVCARRVQAAKWTAEWERPSCAARAVQTCPEQKDRSSWRLWPSMLSRVSGTVSGTYPNDSLINLSKNIKERKRHLRSYLPNNA